MQPQQSLPQMDAGTAIVTPHTPQHQEGAAAISGDLQPVRVQLVGASTAQTETESPIDKAFVF
jgi:hypothetical protein